MADDKQWQSTYKELSVVGSEQLKDQELKPDELGQPDSTYDNEVSEIYRQAHGQRDKLFKFYVYYIAVFTAVVFVLIIVQAIVRVRSNAKFEVMPQWSLNLLVTGMFAQFIGLLKIVTQNIWDFKPFFDHHNEMRNGKIKPDESKDDKALL